MIFKKMLLLSFLFLLNFQPIKPFNFSPELKKEALKYSAALVGGFSTIKALHYFINKTLPPRGEHDLNTDITYYNLTTDVSLKLVQKNDYLAKMDNANKIINYYKNKLEKSLFLNLLFSGFISAFGIYKLSEKFIK